MYNRIIKNITEGRGNLPSVLKINNIPYTKQSYDIVSAREGNIGPGRFEFAFDFFGSTDNINSLKTQLSNDAYMTINRSFIEENFDIYEIDDLSYQAMTIQNYDYYPKIFLYKENDFYNAVKVSNKYICVLKSYTLKKAWILVDKVDNIMNFESGIKAKLVIDFAYKFFSQENNTTLKYPYLNTESNLQNLFADPKTINPTIDIYRYKDNSDSNIVYTVNQQDRYFDYHFSEVNSSEIEDPISPTTYTGTVDKLSLKNGMNSDESFVSVRKSYYLTENKTDLPVNSLMYEVYGYTEDYKTGNRILTSDNISTYKYFEVFPVISDTIHYIMKSKDSTAPTKALVQGSMLASKLYLYNYPELNINGFKIGTTNYIDIYIDIPYYNGLINKDTNITSSDQFTIDSSISFTYDKRSNQDITYFNQSTDGYTELYPFNGYSEYTKDITSNNAIMYYSPDIEEDDLRHFNIEEDEYFNILPKSNNVDKSTYIMDTEYSINDYKDFDSENYNSIKTLVGNYNTQYEQLCTNLYKLLQNSINLSDVVDRTITKSDCLFYYIESSTSDPIEMIYSYTSWDHRKVRTLQGDKHYIIIPYEENLNSIKFLGSATLKYFIQQ